MTELGYSNEREETMNHLWQLIERAGINDNALTESQWARMTTLRNKLGTRSATWGLTSIDDE